MPDHAASVPETRPDYRAFDLLSYEQAAEEFGISVRHLRTLHYDKTRGVRSFKVGGRVRFRWLDLHDYVERCAREAV
jgi:hypothetical protein